MLGLPDAVSACLVVGLDRVGQAEALKEYGAGMVVTDLAEPLDQDGQSGKGAR